MWQLDYFPPFIIPSEQGENFEQPHRDMLLSVVKTILMIQGELMYCGSWYFVFVLVVTGYRVSKQAVEDSKIRSKISPGISLKGSVDPCLQTVSHLQQYFKNLNSLGRESFLVVYCAIVPWASFRLMNSLPGVAVAEGEGGGETIIRKGFYWVVFIYSSTLLCLAAEAKRTVCKIINEAFRRCHYHN